MIFYLGTHEVRWLELTDVPLFISRRRLAKRKTLPRARGPWCVDSSGFTELSLHGVYTFSPAQYVSEVGRYQDEIGRLEWAASMDWMCEESVLRSTGLTVEVHQRRTVENFLELRSLASDLPFIPVLTGWTTGDYLDHVQMYERAGVNLRALPVVGVGTLCRRQETIRASLLLRWLADEGLRLHGFGFKLSGLPAASESLVSSDSLAWSFNARRNPPLPECTHRRCSSCLRFGLEWRQQLLEKLARAKAA